MNRFKRLWTFNKKEILVLCGILAAAIVVLVIDLISASQLTAAELERRHELALLQLNATKPYEIILPYDSLETPVYTPEGGEVGWKDRRDCALRQAGRLNKMEKSHEPDYNRYVYDAPPNLELQPGDCISGSVFRLQNDILDYWLAAHKNALMKEGVTP